jgi:hypothetical protein
MVAKVTKMPTTSPSEAAANPLPPTAVDPLSVICSMCNSQIGEKCTSGPNNWVNWFHLPRVQAAMPQQPTAPEATPAESDMHDVQAEGGTF